MTPTKVEAKLVSNQDAIGQTKNFETNGASYNGHVSCLENNDNRSIQNNHLTVSCLKYSQMMKLQQI